MLKESRKMRIIADNTIPYLQGIAEPVADVIAVTFTAILFSRQFHKSMTALELDAKKENA